MDTNHQYFDCLCRTCMNELEATPQDNNTKPQQQWNSIFDRVEECGAFKIAKLLSYAVPQIKVKLSDELPKRICCKCLQQLLSVYRFQQMCVQSEQQMRQQIPNKQTDPGIPAAAAVSEIGTIHLISFQSSSTEQNIEHTSIQEPLLETTEQVVKPEAAETSDVEIDKLLEDCRDSQGNLSEFVKNEPIEDDDPEMEYSDDDTIQSIISVKDEVMTVEAEEQQVIETNVKKHHSKHAEDDKPYKCTYCRQKFNKISNMYQHKARHEVACDICGKTIVKRHLKNHKLTHSNEKAHKCDFCGKRFNRITCLRIHIRTHTGEKPHKCKYCQRSFTDCSSRIIHMRVHLGDNIHRCKLCPLAFPLAKELRAHLTEHDNDNSETRERNMKALKEAEAKLHLKLSETETQKPSKEDYLALCGPHGGFIRRLELLLKRPLHWFVRLLHFNELPSRHLFVALDKSTSTGPRSATGKLSRQIETCETLPVVDGFQKIELKNMPPPEKIEFSTDSKYLYDMAHAISSGVVPVDLANIKPGKIPGKVRTYRFMHGEDKPYGCPYCPRRFNNSANMYRHKEIHEGVKRVACDICGKSIIKRSLKTHKQIHTKEKAHKCDICEMSFARIGDLRCHMRKHTGEKPYKCKYCERSFSDYRSRIYHMRLHLGDKIYRCQLCPLAFPLAKELRAHLTEHNNDDSKTRERNMKALKEAEAKLQLKLSETETQQQSKENVRTYRFMHGEDKPYGCPYCPRRFNDPANMHRHKEIHEGVKRVACDICGKSITKGSLKTHKLIHSKEKAHKCDICEMGFARINDLRRHMRKHTGEKPYKCKYCERSFSDYSSRINHMRLHLGGNVHRCELCPLAFPFAKELRAHLTEHNNDDSETRERNMKALKEAEAKLQLELSKKETLD